MFSLTIDTDAGRRPPLPDPGSRGIEVWRDGSGRIGALGERRGSRSWMHLLRVATYEFAPGSPEVVAHAVDGASDAVVVDQYYRTVLPMVLQARGHEVLHASAVLSAAGVVAFCATSQSGKSTLAFALGERGLAPWADDAVAFEADASEVAALQVPFDLRLRPASAAHFGQARTVPFGRGGREAGQPLDLDRRPFAALFVLHRELEPAPGREVSLRRLAAGTAVTAALEHAHCFTLDDAERKRRMMEHYLALAARLPVYELRFPTGLEHLAAMAEAVERALGATGHAAPAGAR